MSSRRVFVTALAGTSILLYPVALLAAEKKRGGRVPLERAVARFSAPEGAGRTHPYFVYERELAFEARLVALADPSHRRKSEAYRRHHLQEALERHVAETLLAALSIDPAPSPADVNKQLAAARSLVEEEVGGERLVRKAAELEGLGSLELRRFFRRRAMASLYLHVMVAPMLEPSALELRRVHRRGEGPLADRAFAEAQPALRRWYIARSLRLAAQTYYQNARARLHLTFL